MGKIKLVLLLILVVFIISVTALAYTGARKRALVSHCKNNLRKLAELSIREVTRTIGTMPSGEERSGFVLGKDSMGESIILVDVKADSPAAKTDLRAGDRIKSVDGNEFKEPEDLGAYLGKKEYGETIRISIEREGEELDKSLVLSKPANKPLDVAGRKFWKKLWDEEMKIPQPIHPLNCPFSGNSYSGAVESIDYRGPLRIGLEIEHALKADVIIAADRPENHGGESGGNVAVLHIVAKKVQREKSVDITIKIHKCTKSDPLWSKALAETGD